MEKNGGRGDGVLKMGRWEERRREKKWREKKEKSRKTKRGNEESVAVASGRGVWGWR